MAQPTSYYNRIMEETVPGSIWGAQKGLHLAGFQSKLGRLKRQPMVVA
jgi:hypothetical protein